MWDTDDDAKGTKHITEESDAKTAGSILAAENWQNMVEFPGFNKFWPTTVTRWPPKTDAELGTHLMRDGCASASKSAKDGPKLTWLHDISKEKTPILGKERAQVKADEFKAEPNTIDWWARHQTSDGQLNPSTTEIVMRDSLWYKP